MSRHLPTSTSQFTGNRAGIEQSVSSPAADIERLIASASHLLCATTFCEESCTDGFSNAKSRAVVTALKMVSDGCIFSWHTSELREEGSVTVVCNTSRRRAVDQSLLYYTSPGG